MKRFIAIAGAALLWAGCNEREARRAETPPETTAPGTGGAGTAGEDMLEADRPFIGDAAIVSGKVERVETGRIVLKDSKGEEITVSVHPNTLLVIDGQQRTLGELTEGTEIRATFDMTPTPTGASAEGASEIQIETVPAN